jgi:glyoxylase-like metal-dependent hydrolase (beta-lactamase superfamily II)
MRIHHLNCGTDCPLGGALFDGKSKGLTGHLVCHCLLIETDAHGLVLIDTGYGLKDVHHPHQPPEERIPKFFRALNGIKLREADTAIRQVQMLGFKPEDVRHIVVTHLDFDHAGGLEDFPHATVHVLDKEWSSATGPKPGFIPAQRYRTRQWNEIVHWRRYTSGGGEPWFGFDTVRELEGLPPEILLVPLPGHTWGHAGVAIRDGQGWLFYAGDAYFYRGEVRQEKRECTPGLRFYQTLMETDRTLRLQNLERVRRLSVDHRSEVRVFCAHDAVEFDRCRAGQPL